MPQEVPGASPGVFTREVFSITSQGPQLPAPELIERILSSVTNGISISDASGPDLPLTYVNPAFERMTGYALHEIRGKNCRFLQGTDCDQPGIRTLHDAVLSGSDASVLLRNYRKDGSLFWNELILSPIRNASGVVTHYVGIQADVTARVMFEHALRESEKLAAIGRMSATITHEISGPVSAVMNLNFLAQKCAVDAEAKEYLEAAEAELQRVSQITAQSLSFYRRSQEPLPVRTTDLLDSVLDLYQRHLGKAAVRVEKRHRAASPVVCLESEIRQVLNNLVRNAIDAMRARGGRLLVRTREAMEWRSRERGVVITVADTGEGIPQEALKSIFDAFYSTKGNEGTGLGLWVSAEIVKRHRGRIKVRSRRHHHRSGTVFQLFLPYRAAA